MGLRVTTRVNQLRTLPLLLRTLQQLRWADDQHTQSRWMSNEELWGKMWGKNKKHPKVLDLLDNLAEAQGFEPWKHVLAHLLP